MGRQEIKSHLAKALKTALVDCGTKGWRKQPDGSYLAKANLQFPVQQTLGHLEASIYEVLTTAGVEKEDISLPSDQQTLDVRLTAKGFKQLSEAMQHGGRPKTRMDADAALLKLLFPERDEWQNSPTHARLVFEQSDLAMEEWSVEQMKTVLARVLRTRDLEIESLDDNKFRLTISSQAFSDAQAARGRG